MKDTKLTVTLHIGGKQVDRLTTAQTDRMADRLTETMSLYYTANPAEFSKLKSK